MVESLKQARCDTADGDVMLAEEPNGIPTETNIKPVITDATAAMTRVHASTIVAAMTTVHASNKLDEIERVHAAKNIN